MKRIILITTYCTLAVFHAYGANGDEKTSVKPVLTNAGKEIEIRENITDFPGTKIDTIEVTVTWDGKMTDSSAPLHFSIVGSDFPNNPAIRLKDAKVPNDKYEAHSYTLKIPIETTNLNTGIDREKTALLILNGDHAHFIKLKLVKSHRYDPNKPFWLELGANLDLIDGLQANNLFAGVFLYKRDIRKATSKTEHPNIGIFAGVYESKTLSFSSEKEFRGFTYYNNNSFYHPDSVLIYTDTGGVSYRQQVRNIALFFSPQLRLTNGSANEDGIHLFFSIWGELQWQRITNTLETGDVRRLDSVRIGRTDLNRYGPMIRTEEADIRSHYLGAGFPVYMKWGDANLFFNPIVGGSNQPRESDLATLFTNKTTPLSRIWYGFYVLQFRLSEERYGFAFSGEVRGLLVDNSRPFVTLVLSKKFDLAKLVEFGGR